MHRDHDIYLYNIVKRSRPFQPEALCNVHLHIKVVMCMQHTHATLKKKTCNEYQKKKKRKTAQNYTRNF